ncbi:hypothetical protein QBC38DRAFT_488749 [Podospora fimiseda]|uniref:Uncharacterized protein n=1 Tax=Podospora fimiseda TaxID=252190 RepID=A0AAN6YPA5_9PEZI|nr:hypothetical protein QBC38DRAFT_488749 [Podospora fimiseda]
MASTTTMVQLTKGKKEVNYPEKKGFRIKGLKIEAAEYTDALSNAWKTTRDLASALRLEVEPFINKARKRVDDLLEMIRLLRIEIRTARENITKANKEELFPPLLAIYDAGDPLRWREDEEYKEPL